jgi:hypothetical protein
VKVEELKNALQQAQVAVEKNAIFLAQEKTAKCKGGRIEFKISERIERILKLRRITCSSSTIKEGKVAKLDNSGY